MYHLIQLEIRAHPNDKDALRCPTDMSFKVDVENMINRWKAEVGHDVDIRLYGA